MIRLVYYFFFPIQLHFIVIKQGHNTQKQGGMPSIQAVKELEKGQTASQRKKKQTKQTTT